MSRAKNKPTGRAVRLPLPSAPPNSLRDDMSGPPLEPEVELGLEVGGEPEAIVGSVELAIEVGDDEPAEPTSAPLPAAKAEGQDPAPRAVSYVVAPGRSLTSPCGVLDAGAGVSARTLGVDDERFSHLVAAGFVVARR